VHRYVPVDFEREDLEDALRAAGHRADARSFWIWEGVTTYLTAHAQQATLEAVSRRSAPGSRIAMTYVEPGHAREPGPLLRFFGEPWIGLMSRQEAAERLSRAGLHIVEDTGEPAWRERFCPGPRRHGIVGERIAIAER
jgi:methyltransferase (TIGR00027 family)